MRHLQRTSLSGRDLEGAIFNYSELFFPRFKWGKAKRGGFPKGTKGIGGADGEPSERDKV
jgi:hypothetical protein